MAESPTPFAEIDLGPSKLDQFLDAHQKKLIIAAILIAIGVIVYVIYDGISKSTAQDAGAALVKAESVEEYQEVIKKWPTSNAAATAPILIADVQSLKSKDDAIKTLQDFKENNDKHPVAATAKISLALLLLEEKKDSKKAVEILTEVTESDADSYIIPLAQIILGDIAKANNQKKEAKDWYEKASQTPSAYTNLALSRLAIAKANPPKKIAPALPKITPPKPTIPGSKGVQLPIPPVKTQPIKPVIPPHPTETKTTTSTSSTPAPAKADNGPKPVPPFKPEQAKKVTPEAPQPASPTTTEKKQPTSSQSTNPTSTEKPSPDSSSKTTQPTQVENSPTQENKHNN